MKRNLLLASATVLAALASCTKDSELDTPVVGAMSAQSPIEFASYTPAATATRSTAINSNTDFKTKVGSFEVKSLVSDGTFTLSHDASDHNKVNGWSVAETDGTSGAQFFNFSTVNYDGTSSKWKNENTMYWPNNSKVMHFAAFAPAEAVDDTKAEFSYSYDSSAGSSLSYSFPYKVAVESGNIKQADLMYALKRVDYLAPSDKYKDGATDSYITAGIGNPNTDDTKVNLHFKHALTQILFTATKDADIDVYVKGITICNLYNSGKFTATAITDDSEVTDTDDTIGDDGDKVNADNFGTWETDFTGSWNNLVLTTIDTTPDPDVYKYYAKEGSGGLSSMSHYPVPMVDLRDKSPYTTSTGAATTEINSIKVKDTPTNLSSMGASRALMVMPQKVTAWVPQSATIFNFVGSTSSTPLSGTANVNDEIAAVDPSAVTSALGSYSAVSTATASQTYLAIDCEIYHKGATDYGAKLHDGYIYVPFDSSNIDYAGANTDNGSSITSDEWLAGYKITYCLNFGGGYVVAEGNHTKLPEPGCVPDTNTKTLRTITFTTSVDQIVAAEGADQDMLDVDTSN